jgi:hypothetical protein
MPVTRRRNAASPIAEYGNQASAKVIRVPRYAITRNELTEKFLYMVVGSFLTGYFRIAATTDTRLRKLCPLP